MMLNSTLLILFSLALVVIGGVTRTTRDGKRFPRNVTGFGWALVAIAFISAIFSGQQLRQENEAKRIQTSSGIREIEQAIILLVEPFLALSDPPEISQRFQLVAEYSSTSIFSEGICDVDLVEPVAGGFVDRKYHGKSWGAFIAGKTRQGLRQLKSAQLAYATVLDNETNLLVRDLLAHPWGELLTASDWRAARSTERNFLCSSTPRIRGAYIVLAEAYRVTLNSLERRIGQEACELRNDLGIVDAPPLPLRQISGLVFAPDPEQWDQMMQNVCRSLAKAPAR